MKKAIMVCLVCALLCMCLVMPFLWQSAAGALEYGDETLQEAENISKYKSNQSQTGKRYFTKITDYRRMLFIYI